MENKKKGSVFKTMLFCLAMIVLVLLSFFQAVFGNQNEQPKKNISVVLYSAGDGGWESLEQGIKQAQNDFAVNINYVVLYKDGKAAEQMKAIEREVAEGAEGILVAVENAERFYNLWMNKKFDVPTVFLESGFEEAALPTISADNYEMGKTLGEQILQDFSWKGCPIIALESGDTSRNSVEQREQGFLESLNGKASVISIEEAENGEAADAVAALDKESLLEVADSENTFLADMKKYGIGNTASIVAALEHQKIEKIVFQNEFNMGYIAVETLVDKINGIEKKEIDSIDFYCVDAEEIYHVPYEHLLFPIVE